ncbi:uncharacterized protein LOC143766096 [Ranitomeya variabilis]|uniref:uncharacterized protein LOC143766096 n=1 Tax=Ranitomeya variabilis TaxID=490064 RepID=UPI0040559F2A
MKMFVSSLVPVLLIFILVPGEVMPISYINGSPPNLDRKVGQSATFSCIITEPIDIRELQFGASKTKEKFLNLTMDKNGITSKLSFSGYFEKFLWTIKEENSSSYVCTDKTEMNELEKLERREGANQIDCPLPNENSTFLFLKNGLEQIASFWIKSGDNRSRINISGTLLNLKITLNNLNKKDTGSYECTGKAEGIEEELIGTPTFLTVRDHGIGIYTGNMGLAFVVALASIFLFYWP